MKKIIKFIFRVVAFVERKIAQIKLKTFLAHIGNNTHGHWTVQIKYGENVSIGSNTTIGPYSTFGAMAPITVGNFVRISKGVVMETAGLNLNQPPPYKHSAKPIIIENGVWLATNVIVLGGVTIGENSIIGAGVVISKNIPANSIIVGQPFRALNKKTQR